MRPLRYSINVTLDGCCDHREMFADEELHRHAAENLDRTGALLAGPTRGPMRNGSRGGLIAVRQCHTTAARESNP